jgi:hypothetical protein
MRRSSLMLSAHTQGHAMGRTEKIRQHRDIFLINLLKKERRTFRSQGAVGDFGHLQMRRNRVRHA